MDPIDNIIRQLENLRDHLTENPKPQATLTWGLHQHRFRFPEDFNKPRRFTLSGTNSKGRTYEFDVTVRFIALEERRAVNVFLTVHLPEVRAEHVVRLEDCIKSDITINNTYIRTEA